MRSKLDKSGKFEERRQAWEKKRQQEKRLFAFRYGSLGWGGLMFIFITCLDVFDHHYKLDWPLVFVSLIVWPLAGYGWGMWMWNWCEEHFHGPTNKPPSIIAN